MVLVRPCLDNFIKDMLFSREENTPYTINHYTNQSITINGHCYDSPILIGCQGVIQLPQETSSLKELDIAAISKQLSGSLLVLGKEHVDFYELELLRKKLHKEHITIESMPIGSACRTFNVLKAEDREVSLLILFE